MNKVSQLRIENPEKTATFSQSSVGDGGGGNGGMDDVLKRLGAVEKDVSDIKTQVGAISAVLPHLATKSDVSDLRGATASGLSDVRGSMANLETSIMKWVVMTGLAIIATIIAAAKLL